MGTSKGILWEETDVCKMVEDGEKRYLGKFCDASDEDKAKYIAFEFEHREYRAIEFCTLLMLRSLP